MSRFRLFGRLPEETAEGSEPATTAARRRPADNPPTGAQPAVGRSGSFPVAPRPSGSDGAAAAPPVPGALTPGPGWAGQPPPPPARPATAPAGTRPRYPGDPPTNPFGYPPVAGPPAGSRTGALPGTAGPAPYPDRADAAMLAGAFAVDYLSWDEDDPGRRGRVLADYLPATTTDAARLGWSGRGRQRAEFVLTGRVRPDGEGRVLVDVRVRVTPYRPVGERGRPQPTGRIPTPEIGGTPAAAPAPTAPGWRSTASVWVRLTVPVVLDGDRLLVDAWEELIGAEQPPAPAAHRPAGRVLADRAPADDEPVAEPAGGRR